MGNIRPRGRTCPARRTRAPAFEEPAASITEPALWLSGSRRRRVRLAPLTETRIQRVTAVLRAALNDCRALKVNPAAGIELRVPKRKPAVWTAERVTRWRESGGTWQPGPVCVWTPQQTGQFLDAAEDDRLYPLYMLIAYTGLRRGEAAALAWSEADLDRGLITIRESKSEAGERTVALSAQLVAVLKAWRRQQLAERMAWGPAVDGKRHDVQLRGRPATTGRLHLRALQAAGRQGGPAAGPAA